MIYLWKLLISLIENSISLTGNFLIDFIIFTIFEFIAYCLAYKVVGIISKFLHYNSKKMSIFHWILRIILLIIIIFVTIFILKIIKWLLSFQWYIYIIVAFVFIMVIISIFKRKIVAKGKK